MTCKDCTIQMRSGLSHIGIKVRLGDQVYSADRHFCPWCGAIAFSNPGAAPVCSVAEWESRGGPLLPIVVLSDGRLTTS